MGERFAVGPTEERQARSRCDLLRIGYGDLMLAAGSPLVCVGRRSGSAIDNDRQPGGRCVHGDRDRGGGQQIGSNGGVAGYPGHDRDLSGVVKAVWCWPNKRSRNRNESGDIVLPDLDVGRRIEIYHLARIVHVAVSTWAQIVNTGRVPDNEMRRGCVKTKDISEIVDARWGRSGEGNGPQREKRIAPVRFDHGGVICCAGTYRLEYLVLVV